jgi:YD repeat-containing protein
MRSKRGKGQIGNRLVNETWYSATGLLVNTQTFIYDQDGNLTGAADANGTYTYTYDSAGQMINEHSVACTNASLPLIVVAKGRLMALSGSTHLPSS